MSWLSGVSLFDLSNWYGSILGFFLLGFCFLTHKAIISASISMTIMLVPIINLSYFVNKSDITMSSVHPVVFLVYVSLDVSMGVSSGVSVDSLVLSVVSVVSGGEV